jgi:hypothetical protein
MAQILGMTQTRIVNVRLGLSERDVCLARPDQLTCRSRYLYRSSPIATQVYWR